MVVSDEAIVSDKERFRSLRRVRISEMRSVPTPGYNAMFAPSAVWHMCDVVGVDLCSRWHARFWKWFSILNYSILININYITVLVSFQVLMVSFDVGIPNVFPPFFVIAESINR